MVDGKFSLDVSLLISREETRWGGRPNVFEEWLCIM